MLSDMLAVFASWPVESQLAVAGVVAGSTAYAVDRRMRAPRSSAQERVNARLARMGDDLTGRTPTVVEHWCAGCDRVVRLMDMRWCDTGARWRCRTCAQAYDAPGAPLGPLAAQVVDIAAARRTPVGKAARRRVRNTCKCSDCAAGRLQDTVRVFNTNGQVVAEWPLEERL
ncbi:hypothetical protein TA17A_76 [Mycobacterium phage TA17A]|uniref:Uncharacterized protein n=1 Tax=Mycobacterium phage TA17A TaxID=2928684 RepID=S5VLW0_9CAUD|nr:hypothetical protein FPF50_gp76 [Mycobacterium phage TA17A]AGS81483.1 hypothetical protein TA17A_76 [Mycobacterium phage TA17A]